MIENKKKTNKYNTRVAYGHGDRGSIVGRPALVGRSLARMSACSPCPGALYTFSTYSQWRCELFTLREVTLIKSGALTHKVRVLWTRLPQKSNDHVWWRYTYFGRMMGSLRTINNILCIRSRRHCARVIASVEKKQHRDVQSDAVQ